MIRTIESKTCKLKFNDSDEIARKVLDRILKFVEETGSHSGECISQSDEGQIEGIQTLVDIMDDIIQFEYIDDDN
jgi:dihydrodipicolinate synthase/N-acetylneuraminate lyase